MKWYFQTFSKTTSEGLDCHSVSENNQKEMQMLNFKKKCKSSASNIILIKLFEMRPIIQSSRRPVPIIWPAQSVQADRRVCSLT